MPSPLAHTAIGYVIFRLYKRGFSRKGQRWIRYAFLPLVVIISLSMLPDLDSVPGFLMGDIGRYHNNWTHSLIVGLGVALVISSLVWLVQHSGFSRWFILAMLCYELHIIMDYFTVSPGVKAFWPISIERFASPVPVFYGLRWEDGWLSIRHVLTLVTELGFVALVGIVMYLISDKKGRIPARSLREINR